MKRLGEARPRAARRRRCPPPGSGTACTRLVPRRQPVERSCCMSQATLVETSSTVPAIRPTPGSFRPIAAMSTIETTKAEEIGFESLMPSEMPLTSANTNTSDQRRRRGRAPAGRSTRWPTATTAAPQQIDQITRRTVWTRLQPCTSTSRRRSCAAAVSRQRLTARTEDQRHVDDRRAHDHAERDQERDLAERIARLQPADRDEVGLEQDADARRRSPPATPMRAPTTMPAPKVDVESSIAPRIGDLGRGDAADQPAATPPPSSAHRAAQQHRVGERAQDVGDREARREGELAGGRPGSACRACRRRRRTCRCTGSRARAATSAAAAGRATPSPGSARPCALMPATDAAAVCM